MTDNFISKQTKEYIYNTQLTESQRKNYVTNEDAMVILGINDIATFKKVASGLSIDNIEVYRSKFYNLESLKSIVLRYENLSKEYIGLSEAYTLIGRKVADKLERIPAPDFFNIITHNAKFKSRYLLNRALVYEIQEASFSNEKSYNKSNPTYLTCLTEEERKIYVPTSECMKLWSINNDKQFCRLALKLKIDSIKVNSCVFYKRQSLIDIADKYKKFHEEYMTLKEAQDLLGLSSSQQLIRIPAPPGYTCIVTNIFNLKNITSLVSRKAVSTMKKKLNNITESSSSYLSTTEAAKYLNLSKRRFSDIGKKYITFVESPGQKRTKLYLKSDLDKIKKMQDEFWKLHIESSEINKLYNKDIDTITKNIETLTTPDYAITIDNAPKFCYKRDVVLKIINDLKTTNTIRSIYGNTPFETFKLKLNMYSNLDDIARSIYTKEKWLEFVKGKLSSSQGCQHTIDADISNYISATILLNNMLTKYSVPEVYSLTSKQINDSLKEYTIKTHKCYLHSFLSQVYQDICLLNSEYKVEKKFTFEKILNPRNEESNENITSPEETIYDFETYSVIFKYVTNINFHISKAIQSTNKKYSIVYLSTWLYVALHLNNAWRHGDVSTFPRLNVDDLLQEFGVNNIKWFLKNKLTLTQSRKVITRILHTELTISKTQVKGHFFCSDILAPTISTIILMIELSLSANNHLRLSSNEPCMRFYTKYNRVREYMLDFFFNDIELNNFIFGSKKMNKTIMTYIYYLANVCGSQEALEYVQYMRSHLDKNTTLFYIKLDYNSLNQLSKQLFERGEFGYIPSLLINRLNGNPLDFEDVTKQIIAVNNIFDNSILKLETTAGLINQIRSERSLVTKIIMEKSLEECEILLTNMFFKNLTSKTEDIQCLFAKENCKKNELKEKGMCFRCPYSIPSIYSLTALCQSLLQDFNKYSITINRSRKKQLSTSIHRKLFALKEAMYQFGKEYVYSCLDLNKEDLLAKIELIPSIEEIPLI